MCTHRSEPHRGRTSGRVLALLFLGLFLVPDPGRAQTFVFGSLRDPLTAVQSARGGPLPTEPGGAETIRSNPCWLAQVDRIQVAASHRRWQLGLQEQWTGGVIPAGPGGLALEASALHAGALPGYAPDGTPTGTFRPIELVLGVGYGVSIGRGFAAGLSGQVLHLEAPDEPLRGFCLGAGVGVEWGAVRLGLSLRHLGPDLQGENGRYGLPTEAALGGAFPLRSGTSLCVSGALDRLGSWRGGASVRWEGPAGFALIGGMTAREALEGAGPRAHGGLQLDLESVAFAYAVVPEDELGTAHHFTVEFRAPAGASREAAPAGPDPAPAPSTWSVWGGVHPTRDGAQQEVRALEIQSVAGAEILSMPTGMHRVRIAADLSEEEARNLARRVNAVASRQ